MKNATLKSEIVRNTKTKSKVICLAAHTNLHTHTQEVTRKTSKHPFSFQAETNVVLIEGHPWTPFDRVWQDFFNSTRRLSQLPRKTFFKNLVWSIGSHDNPMSDFMDPELPLSEEFRDLVLSTYQIDPHNHKLNCSRLSILLLLRHDYVAHARNPRGVIQRKFANEKELVQTIRQNFPDCTLQAVQLDLFRMETQLDIISRTDMLIGMLGAGLTHAMFLPETSGLIELRPLYYTEISQHFESITKWRHLPYIRWNNRNRRFEKKNYRTRIPTEVMTSLVKRMRQQICSRHNKF